MEDWMPTTTGDPELLSHYRAIIEQKAREHLAKYKGFDLVRFMAEVDERIAACPPADRVLAAKSFSRKSTLGINKKFRFDRAIGRLARKD